TYQDGVFVTGATRGNGIEGEDVTANLRTVLDVPLRLHGQRKTWPKLMEVRGEVYLSKSRFAELNTERERAGEPTFANPRNAAAGGVVKVNPLERHAELGTVGDREPRWAIARKFAPEVRITKLKEIRINVGRTGALNPYAVLEPVEIGGVTVSTATLHNFALI